VEEVEEVEVEEVEVKEVEGVRMEGKWWEGGKEGGDLKDKRRRSK